MCSMGHVYTMKCSNIIFAIVSNSQHHHEHAARMEWSGRTCCPISVSFNTVFYALWVCACNVFQLKKNFALFGVGLFSHFSHQPMFFVCICYLLLIYDFVCLFALCLLVYGRSRLLVRICNGRSEFLSTNAIWFNANTVVWILLGRREHSEYCRMIWYSKCETSMALKSWCPYWLLQT